MTYGAPVWIKALVKEFNRKIYNMVQRLINKNYQGIQNNV